MPGTPAVDELLRLSGRKLDTDLELGLNRIAGFFEATDKRRR